MTAVVYATLSDMQARFGTTEIEELENRNTDDDDDDAADGRVTAALADASAEIDASLAQTYALPLKTGTWPLLRALACRLARARLYDNAIPDDIMEDQRGARARLKSLASGELRLVDDDGTVVLTRTLALRDGPDPVMTADALAGL